MDPGVPSTHVRCDHTNGAAVAVVAGSTTSHLRPAARSRASALRWRGHRREYGRSHRGHGPGLRRPGTDCRRRHHRLHRRFQDQSCSARRYYLKTFSWSGSRRQDLWWRVVSPRLSVHLWCIVSAHHRTDTVAGIQPAPRRHDRLRTRSRAGSPDLLYGGLPCGVTCDPSNGAPIAITGGGDVDGVNFDFTLPLDTSSASVSEGEAGRPCSGAAPAPSCPPRLTARPLSRFAQRAKRVPLRPRVAAKGDRVCPPRSHARTTCHASASRQ